MHKTSASVKPGLTEVQSTLLQVNSKEHSKPTAVLSNSDGSAN